MDFLPHMWPVENLNRLRELKVGFRLDPIRSIATITCLVHSQETFSGMDK